MNIAVVRDASTGNLCLHLCFQLNMLTVFNQQSCCFISMFCAAYSLSDNVVITKFFPTSKLGGYPSVLNSHLIPKYDEIFIFLRIISVFSENTKYPFGFIKESGGWAWSGFSLAAVPRCGHSRQAPQLAGTPCRSKLRGWQCCRKKRLQAARRVIWGYSVEKSSSSLARKTMQQQLSTMEMGNDRLLVTNLQKENF